MDTVQQPFISRFHSDEFYQSLLAAFSDDLPAVLARLQKFISEREFSGAKADCHQMIGSSATYGYPVLAGLFEHLESVLEMELPDDQQIASDLKLLESMIEKIREFTSTLSKT